MSARRLGQLLGLAAVLAGPLAAQSGPRGIQSELPADRMGSVADDARHVAEVAATTIRDEFLGHFERSSYKIAELARVMPEAKMSWAPADGVMQVAEVYMHLARYNFMYLDENLGIAAPNGFEYADIESIRDKEQVRRIFDMSVEHVKTQVSAMTESGLSASTQLYGRDVEGWVVLVQLISHMNEHVGQSVAYARMNGITPPWAR